MSTLYELTGQLLQLMEMAEDETCDPEAIRDTMEGLEMEVEEKADGYAKIIKTLEGNAASIDTEIKRLQEKKSSLANNINRLKKNLEKTMIVTGKKKFKTLLFGFNIQKNPPSVLIEEGAEVPEKYLVPQDPKIDKKAILADLKAGSSYDKISLVQTESLRIR